MNTRVLKPKDQRIPHGSTNEVFKEGKDLHIIAQRNDQKPSFIYGHRKALVFSARNNIQYPFWLRQRNHLKHYQTDQAQTNWVKVTNE